MVTNRHVWNLREDLENELEKSLSSARVVIVNKGTKLNYNPKWEIYRIMEAFSLWRKRKIVQIHLFLQQKLKPIQDLADLKLPDPTLLDYYLRRQDRCILWNDDIEDDFVEIYQDILRWNKEDIGKMFLI
ncbi:hypothetical protein [Eubacterium ramulus]|uniref:hypothetical protein n=1 Tax=Eubacterium ramulus TaxID=39490 RepID=UPI003999B222